MKPITLLKHEFDEALVALVNNCGLPACVIKPSVVNLVQLLERLEQQQLEQDIASMEEPDQEEEITEE